MAKLTYLGRKYNIKLSFGTFEAEYVDKYKNTHVYLTTGNVNVKLYVEESKLFHHVKVIE